MDKVAYAIKIDSALVEKIRVFCAEHGIKQGFFVEKALREQLVREELVEDLFDFKNLRSEELNAVGFEEYLKLRAH